MGNVECCSGFGKRVCPFISGKSRRTHWKLRATREERKSERSQISQKDFSWRNAGDRGEKGEGRLGVR